MNTYPDIKMDEYYFVDQGNLFDRTTWWYQQKLIDPIMPLSIYRPTIYKRKRTAWKIPGFIAVAKLIGLHNAELETFLKWHNRRLSIFMILLIFLEIVISMGLFIPVVYGLPGFIRILFTLSLNINLTILVLFTLLLLLLVYRLAFGISALLLERKFADSLCIMQITYILLELTRHDVIQNRKTDLLNRMNFLANKLILMGMNYSGSDEVNKKWAYDYFRKISRFIREREKLVLAPNENSLEQLRQDFSRLGKIFASGQYGSFDFQVDEAEKVVLQPKSLLTQIFNLIIGIASIAAPILVLIFMVTSPELFSQLNINRDAVFYISIAWLLLALDKLFGMGIVESFLSLLKATKELR